MLNIEEHYNLIRRMFYGRWATKVRQAGLDPDDVFSDVLMGVHVGNQGNSPYDPERGAPSTYINQVCKTRVSNALDKRRRRYWEVLGDEDDAAQDPGGHYGDYSAESVAGMAELMELDPATIQGIIDGEYSADEVLAWLDDEGDEADDDYLMFLPLFGSGEE